MIALVTGASRGIGRSVVEHFEAKGIRVVTVSRGDVLSIVQKESRLECRFNWSDFDALASGLKERLGDHSIGYVINNAAMLETASLASMDENHFIEHMKVNVWNIIAMFNALNEASIFRPDAHHIYIGSVGGVQGTKKFPGISAYSISKAALAGLMESMAVENASTDMSFNYLALGSVNTEMLRTAFPGYISQVDPENMAEFIVSFALTASGLVNGQIISVTNSDPEA